MKTYIFILIFSALANYAFAQTENVGIGTNNPDNSAVLHLDKQLLSSPKGFLVPRMTTAERNSIVNPATGLLIFNTDSVSFEFNSAGGATPVWTKILGSSLPDGNIIIGNSSGYAGVVPITGDISLANSGLSSVLALRGRSISSAAPADGQIYSWNNSLSEWVPTSIARAWSVTGNSSLDETANYLGTNDSVDLVIKTNNTERLRILSDGNAGIGTSSPVAALDVAGSVKIGSAGSVLNHIIKVASQINETISANSVVDVSVTVTGAQTGSSVIASPSNDLSTSLIIGYAFVSASDTVKIRFFNTGATDVNLSETFDITIIK